MFDNEKELKFLESEIERIGKKEKAREKDNEEFLDRIYTHAKLNKPNGEKRDEIQRGQKEGHT